MIFYFFGGLLGQTLGWSLLNLGKTLNKENHVNKNYPQPKIDLRICYMGRRLINKTYLLIIQILRYEHIIKLKIRT